MDRQPYPQKPYPQQSYPQQPYLQQPYPQQPYPQQPYPQRGVPVLLVAPRARSVNDVLPGYVPGLLGGLQLVLWLTILGLEVGGLFYDPLRGTAYAGFWCGAIFFDTWISMFCYLCCGKTSGCAIYLLVQNIINMIFSIVLMAITSRFVNDSCSCFLSFYCDIISLTDVITDGSWIGFNCLGKLPLLKGLLACSILMFLSNIAYIIAYIAISIWLRYKAPPSDVDRNAVYQRDANLVEINQQQPYHPAPAHQHEHHSGSHRPRSNHDHHSSSTRPPPPYKEDPSDDTSEYF